MEVIEVNKDPLPKAAIEKIVNCLRKGGVVALPTDTSYGLCANVLDGEAVGKIFAIKQRPASKPLSVIVRDLTMLGEVAKVGKRERKIIAKHLPGSFTFVLPKKEVISGIVSGGGDTVGVRMPDFPLIQKIALEIDFPLTATSANLSGGKSTYSAQELIGEFAGCDFQLDLVVDAGDLPPSKPSTIVDLTCDSPKVLRVGSGKFSS